MKNGLSKKEKEIIKKITLLKISMSKKKSKNKTPYIVALIKNYFQVKQKILRASYIVLKDTKDLDKQESKALNRKLGYRNAYYSIVTEKTLFSIEEEDLHYFKRKGLYWCIKNVLVITDRTEDQKPIKNMEIHNGLGKSRVLKGYIEAIFRLRNELDSEDLKNDYGKCDISTKKRIIYKLKTEITKELKKRELWDKKYPVNESYMKQVCKDLGYPLNF